MSLHSYFQYFSATSSSNSLSEKSLPGQSGNDANTEDLSEGIKSLEKQLWLQWIFVLVGTLGPAIKLASMQGVP